MKTGQCQNETSIEFNPQFSMGATVCSGSLTPTDSCLLCQTRLLHVRHDPCLSFHYVSLRSVLLLATGPSPTAWLCPPDELCVPEHKLPFLITELVQ